MIVSDLVIMRDSFLPSLVIFTVIGTVMAFGSESAVIGAACIGAMGTVTFALVLAQSDESGSWENLRATLPLSRKDAMVGRYASIPIASLGSCIFAVLIMGFLQFAVIRRPLLWVIQPPGVLHTACFIADQPLSVVVAGAFLGGAAALLGTAVVLPFIAKIGATKAARCAAAICALFALACCFVTDGLLYEAGWLFDFRQWCALNPTLGYPLIAAAGTAITLMLYAASAALSAKIYESREF